MADRQQETTPRDGKWCPRDSCGFCWIALWNPADCGGVSDESGGPVRCPETAEEAQGRMEAARQHRIEEVRANA